MCLSIIRGTVLYKKRRIRHDESIDDGDGAAALFAFVPRRPHSRSSADDPGCGRDIQPACFDVSWLCRAVMYDQSLPMHPAAQPLASWPITSVEWEPSKRGLSSLFGIGGTQPAYLSKSEDRGQPTYFLAPVVARARGLSVGLAAAAALRFASKRDQGSPF